jgi:ferritin-like metal-binding protein YciE
MGHMTKPQELFEHELKDVYYAEKALERMLPTLAQEANNPELTRAFQKHLQETREQIQNLDKVFREIGKPPQGESCPGIDGIKAEHDKFMREESATTDIRDVFLTGAAARTEHYEIAAYTGLISKARTLGEKKAVELLDKNLRQEKEALKTVESISKRLLREAAKTTNGRRSSGTSRRGASTTRRTTSTSRRTTSTARRKTTSGRRTSR